MPVGYDGVLTRLLETRFRALMALPKRLLALVVVSVGSLFAINSLLEQSTVAVQSTSTGEGTAQLNRLHNQHKMLLGRAMELRQRYASGTETVVKGKEELNLQRDRDVLQQRIAALRTESPTGEPTAQLTAYDLPLLRPREPYGAASSNAVRKHSSRGPGVSRPGPLRPNSVTEFITGVVELIGKLRPDGHTQVATPAGTYSTYRVWRSVMPRAQHATAGLACSGAVASRRGASYK